MSERSEKILNLMSKFEMSYGDLSKLTKIPKSALQRYATGETEKIPIDRIESIAKALECSASYLMGWEGAQTNNSETKFDYKAYAEMSLAEKDESYKIALRYRNLDEHGKEVVRNLLESECKRMLSYQVQEQEEKAKEYYIDYYDLPASAGTGSFLYEDTSQSLKVPETPTTLRADFAVRVSGDSMEPKYYDGDILLVENALDIDIGEIGIFVLNGDGYVKKRGESGLISLNKKYKPIAVHEYDNCRCIGKVIGKL